MRRLSPERRNKRRAALRLPRAKRLIRRLTWRFRKQAALYLWRASGLPALHALRRQAFGKGALGETYVVPRPTVYAAQAETLRAAATNHLTRVGLLADTEWKVSLAFWTLLLASGVGLIATCAGDRPVLVTLILSSGGVILSGYLVSCALFVFGFSVNQSQSINTERNRFLYYQSAALYAVDVNNPQAHVPVKAPRGEGPLSTVARGQVRLSTVWATKLVSSTVFVIGSWATAMIVAAARQHPVGTGPIDWYATINLLLACILLPCWCLMTVSFFLRAQRAAR